MSKSFDMIILCGGQGTRLRPIISDVPKILAPINGVPFLDIFLNYVLDRAQPHRIILAIGYQAEKVISYIKEAKHLPHLEYSVEEQSLGTGGAVRNCLSHLEADKIIIANGDTLVKPDYVGLFDCLDYFDAALSIVPQNDCTRFGRVEFLENCVTSFIEKNQSQGHGFINAGVYGFTKKYIEKFPTYIPLSLERDVLPQLVERRKLGVVQCQSDFIDIGTPDSYKNANQFIA